VYGLVSYLVFFGSFLYAIGFVGNIVVPKSIDSGTAGPFVPSLIIDAVLLGLFAIQHSVMARQNFKRWWTRCIPKPKGKQYTDLVFKKRFLYSFARHPLLLGFVIAFWATPKMTLGHLVFAIGTTAFILIAIQFEERDMANIHGDAYREYKREVSMLIPLPKSKYTTVVQYDIRKTDSQADGLRYDLEIRPLLI